MWNHRDLENPIQQQIESIIKSSIPTYSYGSRREDPTDLIQANGHFSPAKSIEGHFVWEMPKSDVIAAWQSHATLQRQAGSDAAFNNIIEQIARYLDKLPEIIPGPYTTRIFFARKVE